MLLHALLFVSSTFDAFADFVARFSPTPISAHKLTTAVTIVLLREFLLKFATATSVRTTVIL